MQKNEAIVLTGHQRRSPLRTALARVRHHLETSWQVDVAFAALRPPPQAVRLHLGVHKTATTHLQDTLFAHREALLTLGIDFLHYVPLRISGFPFRIMTEPVPRAFYARRLRGRLNRLRRPAPTLAISDENWLCGVLESLEPDPFPDLARPLEAMRPLLDGPELRIFLAVRDMGTHLPSAYAQHLRFNLETRPIEAFVEARKAAGASWLGPVRRLRALFPEVPITIWRYEDYTAHMTEIVATFLGRDVGPLPDLPRPASTRSPSAEAIAEARALAATKPSLDRYLREAAATLDAGRPGRRFAPINEEDRAWFSTRYEADLAALAAMEGVEVLRFGS